MFYQHNTGVPIEKGMILYSHCVDDVIKFPSKVITFGAEIHYISRSFYILFQRLLNFVEVC